MTKKCHNNNNISTRIHIPKSKMITLGQKELSFLLIVFFHIIEINNPSKGKKYIPIYKTINDENSKIVGLL